MKEPGSVGDSIIAEIVARACQFCRDDSGRVAHWFRNLNARLIVNKLREQKVPTFAESFESWDGLDQKRLACSHSA